ncbi:MAG: CocE/NonD family hydrolase C-terminal non-catalytic domain-containing protein [Clostridia bacterium]
MPRTSSCGSVCFYCSLGCSCTSSGWLAKQYSGRVKGPWELPKVEANDIVAAKRPIKDIRQRALGRNIHFWDEPYDTYVFDPKDPAPFLIDVSENYREVDKREDVLVYNSSPLESDIAIAGNIYAKIYAASSSRDTDWLVRLKDVDGNSMHLTDGILRARILIAKILSTPLFSKLKSLFRC